MAKKKAGSGIELELAGSEEAYLHFLPKALALGKDEVVPFRVQPALAHANVAHGVASILKEKETIAAELPKLHLHDAGSLPDLALGLVFASTKVDRSSPGTTKKLLEQASHLRGLLLKGADALVAAGLLPEHDVARIHEGTGKTDIAKDCVDLASLFKKHAAKIKGKTAVTAKDALEASKVGSELLAVLKPKAAKKTPSAPLETALDERDRLGTLLANGYDKVRRAGGWLFGLDAVDALVPPLGSHARHRHRKPGGSGATTGGDAKTP